MGMRFGSVRIVDNIFATSWGFVFIFFGIEFKDYVCFGVVVVNFEYFSVIFFFKLCFMIMFGVVLIIFVRASTFRVVFITLYVGVCCLMFVFVLCLCRFIKIMC